MKVEDHKVVGIEYTLKDKTGDVVDTNVGDESLYFIQGLGSIVPGLERAMHGRPLGDSFEIEIKAAEGYGEFDATKVRKIPKSVVKNLGEVTPGMMLQAQGPDGMEVVTVTQVTETEVHLDANHPMAGKDLFFAIRIAEIRDATEDELAHGHAHGPGGHHHH